MKNTISLSFICVLFLAFASCKTDDDNTPEAGQKTPASNTVSMTANLNGSPWAAEYVTAVQFNQGSSGFWELTLKGENEAGDEVLQFALIDIQSQQFTSRTYDFGGPGADVVATFILTRPSENWILQTDTVNTGQVVINDIGASVVSGTFSASLMDGLGGTMEVSDGRFESNNYTTR